LADAAADETILLRWTCQQVLQAAGDARAAPLLERLFADVQTRASALTSPADRSRLIQAIATFNDIVAAHTRALPTTP
jgi:hypothetical protein